MFDVWQKIAGTLLYGHRTSDAGTSIWGVRDQNKLLPVQIDSYWPESIERSSNFDKNNFCRNLTFLSKSESLFFALLESLFIFYLVDCVNHAALYQVAPYWGQNRLHTSLLMVYRISCQHLSSLSPWSLTPRLISIHTPYLNQNGPYFIFEGLRYLPSSPAYTFWGFGASHP